MLTRKRKLMLGLACAIPCALLPASCGGASPLLGGKLAWAECHGAFYVEPGDFERDEIISIQIAAERWNKWIGRSVMHVDLDDRSAVDRGCRISAKALDAEVAADYHPDTGEIEIDRSKIIIKYEAPVNTGTEVVIYDSYGPELMRQVLFLHEFGHSFGMNHVLSEPAIMNPSRSLSVIDFTDADRRECSFHPECIHP